MILVGLLIPLSLVVVVGSVRLAPVWGGGLVLLLLLHLADAIRVPRAGDVAVSGALPATVPVGATVSTTLQVTDVRGRDLDATLLADVDALDPLDPVAIRGTGGTAVVPLRVRAPRRGPAGIPRVWMRLPGPLGLLERKVRHPLGLRTTAVPDLHGVRGAALRFTGSELLGAGLQVEKAPGVGSEFDSLREFQRGHDPRAIDWKSSARHTRLLVREYRAERNHPVMLVVDTGRLMSEPLGALTRLDHAIHAALLLGYVSLRNGDRVGLHAFDAVPRVRLSPRSGVASFPALARTASSLGYGEAETNFTLGLLDLRRHLTRRSLVVVLTDFVDGITAELILENLRALSRRHLVLFVAIADPSLSGIEAAAPRDAGHLHRSVVASTLLRDRTRVIRRLSRAGIDCLDVPPGRIDVALVNRYLDIKRRERIG